MPPQRKNFCKFCRDPIMWATTESGKPIALEASSDPRGTYMLALKPGHDGMLVRIARALTRAEREEVAASGELLFLAHKAVCSERSDVPRVGTKPSAAQRAEIARKIAESKRRAS